MEEPCKGCVEAEVVCSIWRVGQQEECPCMECLLKPICRTPCSKFNTMWFDCENKLAEQDYI